MDILVIGGGLLGVSTAYVLRESGHDVTLLEAQEGVGLETSYANGGMLTPSQSAPWNTPGIHRHLLMSVLDRHASVKVQLAALPSLLGWGVRFLGHASSSHARYATEVNFQLARYSVEQTAVLRERLGLEYDADTRGTLRVFRDREDFRRAMEQAEALEPLGLDRRVLDLAEAVKVEPQLGRIRGDVCGVVHYPGDESGDAHRFCCALAEAFVDAGGRLRTAVRAGRVLKAEGRVRGVTTHNRDGERGEDYPTDVVVVAAGNGSGALVRSLGLRLPIRPVKGYSITLDADQLEESPRIPVVDQSRRTGVVPLGHRLRLVGIADFCGLDPTLDPDRLDHLYEGLADLYPHISEKIDRNRGQNWAGFRPMSADGIPFVSATPVDGLYLNTGHGHLGWTKAVGSARLVADLIEGHQPAIDARPYRLQR